MGVPEAMNGWGTLLPGQVSDYINFDSSNPAWTYEGPSSTSMASRQAEGVAYLWNQLSQQGLALLADEVGMGKTYQALGVAALLWRMKPQARVLVLTPNREICAQWQREYGTFVRKHYRPIDHCVKNSATAAPVQSIHSCWKLEELADLVETRPGHLYLTTIHSLSGLVPYTEKGSNNVAIARERAGEIQRRIKQALGKQGFDLIIVDEAHYFRKRDGGSQRVNAAEAFFAGPEGLLGDKVLLLTATPSHSSLGDVENILGYFRDMKQEPDNSVLALMQKYGLRRFRRLRGRDGHLSKREYRREIDTPCDFEGSPEAELFFALYQKKLVTELKCTRDNKSLLYGFLEGFESVGRRHQEASATAEELPDEVANKDFSRAPDSELLSRLTLQYDKHVGGIPDHPKYGQLVGQCVPADILRAPRDLHDDKHLVFVRRIPSVRELTQRINAAYDALLAKRICDAWGVDRKGHARWKRSGWGRAAFEEMIRNLRMAEDVPEIEGGEQSEAGTEEEGDAQLGSAIADLFVVKDEKGKVARTDCANVSLRFRKPESAFALFLEPSADYLEAPYSYCYEGPQADKQRLDYVNAAQDERLLRHELASPARIRERKNYREPLHTLWSLVLPALAPDEQAVLREWSRHWPAVAENFANYLKTGFLFASPVMVEIYCWFTEFSRSNSDKDVQLRYRAFLEYVRRRLPQSLLLAYFKSALGTFETLCEKILDHKSHEWQKEWRALKSLQNPAWYASGESKNRHRLIMGFNSPFYPNVLVATSVFQEGVNLHLQCRKVHHYGIAGSPGDNEQRVGRVDRLFGKVNQLLHVDGQTELEIRYPFLKNSLDEDQVASFIARKFAIEEKMDACLQPTFDRKIELTQVNWRDFLRKPVKAISVKDPYPAHFDGLAPDVPPYRPVEIHDEQESAGYIKALLLQILDPGSDALLELTNAERYPDALYLIDPVVKEPMQRRRQPILVERRFSADYSALVDEAVHYLSLRSPIASRQVLTAGGALDVGRLGQLCEGLAADYPLARIALDPAAARSHFYLQARVDLPVFARKGKLNMLSRSELALALHHLKHASDRLEYELFGGARDLEVNDLNLDGLQRVESAPPNHVDHHPASDSRERWELLRGQHGSVERLTSRLSVGFLDRSLELDESAEACTSPVLRALVLNCHIPFLSFWSTGSQCQVTLTHPEGDLQHQERELLERWFDYIVGCDWKERGLQV